MNFCLAFRGETMHAHAIQKYVLNVHYSCDRPNSPPFYSGGQFLQDRKILATHDPVGASGTINQFALQHVCHLINKEIEDLAPYLKSPTSLDTDKETLTATSFGNLSEKMQSVTPTLWQLLNLLHTVSVRKRKTYTRALSK